jgi:FAD/FMN-containing dehydrogenase
MTKPTKPNFIVRAGSKEDVQAVIRVANEYKIPVMPMGALTDQYMESIPAEGGIMLDFKRMKKIEIDEENRTVTLEPGVTWAQAYREMAVRGYWLGFQASPGSVQTLGTTTQAGTHLPWDKYGIGPLNRTYYSDLTIGTEIVLPTGELLITGAAALPGAKPGRERAYGPGVAFLFLASQGTLGIVVKQTLPLWPIPEYRHVVEGDFKDANFKGIVNAMSTIRDDNYGGPVWAEKVWSEYHNGVWEFYVHLYGKKRRVEFEREFVENLIREEGGTIKEGWARTLDPENDYSGGLMQFYEEMIYWRPRANSIAMPPPNISWVTLSGSAPPTMLPKVHAAMHKLLTKHGVEKDRLRSGRLMPSLTALSVNFTYLYDLNDAEEVKRAKAINQEWPSVQAEALGRPLTPGMTELRYRLPPDMARQEIRKLGEYYKLLAKLKRTLDPNRIMNRGKLMDIEPY